MLRAHRDMHQQNKSGKTNFLSIFYQGLIQHRSPGTCTWHLFKLGLFCFLTMLAFEPGHCNAKQKKEEKIIHSCMQTIYFVLSAEISCRRLTKFESWQLNLLLHRHYREWKRLL